MIDVHVKFRDAECIVRLEAIGVNNAVGSNSLFDARQKFRFLAVTLLLFWFFYPTEEERILAQFDELSPIASKSGAALTIADALVLENSRDLFAPKVSLKTGRRARLVSQYTDRELMQLYGRIRLQAKRLSLRFENIEIRSLEETDATTTADGHAEINFRKIDGIWKFRPFIYIESLPGK